MLVLKQFSQAITTGSVTTVSEGWVFSSKALLLNLANVLQATNGTNVYLSCDGTYKLLHNGWVLLNLISETIVESDGGTIVKAYYLLYIVLLEGKYLELYCVMI